MIIGISKDSLDSHQQFQKKYDFPFILLSDPSTETIQKYDVWKEKNYMEKPIWEWFVLPTSLMNKASLFGHKKK